MVAFQDKEDCAIVKVNKSSIGVELNSSEIHQLMFDLGGWAATTSRNDTVMFVLFSFIAELEDIQAELPQVANQPVSREKITEIIQRFDQLEEEAQKNV